MHSVLSKHWRLARMTAWLLLVCMLSTTMAPALRAAKQDLPGYEDEVTVNDEGEDADSEDEAAASEDDDVLFSQTPRNDRNTLSRTVAVIAGGAIFGLRNFHSVDLDVDIIDLQSCQSAQNMFNRMDLSTTCPQNRSAQGVDVFASVFWDHVDGRIAREVRANESHSTVGGRRLERGSVAFAGMKADSRKRNFLRDSSLHEADRRDRQFRSFRLKEHVLFRWKLLCPMNSGLIWQKQRLKIQEVIVIRLRMLDGA